MEKRSYRLDMDYTQMWSLVNDLPTEELQEEIERLQKESNTLQLKTKQISSSTQTIESKKSVLKKILKYREDKELQKIVPTEEHKKLIKMIDFKKYEDDDDYVFIGCNGKRPFGNSGVYSHIAEILGWELPNDNLSNQQYAKADQLLKELPFVINNILKNV